MLKKSQEVHHNSQYIAHYAQVEPIKMLTEINMRQVRLSYTIIECGHFSFAMCSASKVGTS